MRRLLRRAIRFAFELGIEQNFLQDIVPVITELYKDDYPEVATQSEAIVEVLVKEEKVFRQTLRKGLKVFEKKVAGYKTPYVLPVTSGSGKMTGSDIFQLYDTYGFPVELSAEEAIRRGINIDGWRTEF